MPVLWEKPAANNFFTISEKSVFLDLTAFCTLPAVSFINSFLFFDSIKEPANSPHCLKYARPVFLLPFNSLNRFLVSSEPYFLTVFSINLSNTPSLFKIHPVAAPTVAPKTGVAPIITFAATSIFSEFFSASLLIIRTIR